MRSSIVKRQFFLFAFETFLILLSVAGAMALRFGKNVFSYFDLNSEWHHIAAVVGITQLSFYYNDLYELSVLNSRRELFIRLLRSLGIASILLALIYYINPGLMLGDGVFIVFVCLLIAAVVLWRMSYTNMLSLKGFSIKILLVGAGDLAKGIYKETLNRKRLGFQVLGCLAANPDEASKDKALPPVLGGFDALMEYGKRSDIDKIVVAVGERRGKFPFKSLLDLRVSGARVEDGCAFYEELTGKMMIDYLRPSHIIFSEGFSKKRFAAVIKRAVDLVMSFIILIVSIPIWLIIPLAIKLDSKGPVFFKQTRVGERGKEFDVLKFRSMRSDAELHSGPVWAQDGDDRVTRVGRFMRKTRIDEIPQLINVFKGEMSFVGPRPERPFFVKELAEQIQYYQQRHSVKPGITGLAQVKYDYGSSIEDALEKLRYDFYYIKHMGFWMDVSIIFETVKVVLFGKGAK